MSNGLVAFFSVAFAACLALAQAPPAGQAQGGPGAGRGRGPQAPPLLMTIPGFADGSMVPTKFTCAAQPAVSPEVRWSQVPPGTQSFILLVHDPEPRPAKGIMDNTHWLIWNIPGTATGLPEGVPAGNTLPDGSHQPPGRGGAPGAYFGPCAGPGPSHHYTWELLALDTKLDLPENATRPEVMKAADGHVLGAAIWIGLYHR